jgi:succinoglycan biosynthesis protein ExoM
MTSPSTQTSETFIDIGVCTFRREHVAETLRSLSKLELKPGWHLRVIVADNDDQPTARGLVEATARECGLNVSYIHAPARNISIARNACLDTATAPLLAFVDDDETVTRQWLTAIVAEQERTNADVVLGPVVPVYRDQAPEWMKRGRFHASKPVWVKGSIITGYTCNTLITRTNPAVKSLRFKLELGRTGGEDTIFFSEVFNAGGHLAYAVDAVVNETVPLERERLGWLLKRRFRYGQSHSLTLLQGAGSVARIRALCMAAAKLAFCFALAAGHIFDTSKMMFWVLRGTLHAGVIARLLGKRELEQYG